ncbi:hypothetical protein FISHEDRAFT_69036 [Fistulina hepatica ATCC 64428]|uniref:Uncharacterized protein n=1 Tax=Fistulina hepatica ATCC 64428 TaxID=1128425 RepID=A0A0D7AN34_9AGAR|nr:hypothetical protein FISHEDRAFT_69036 [Fistulina hepatica ATCC 64428]
MPRASSSKASSSKASSSKSSSSRAFLGCLEDASTAESSPPRYAGTTRSGRSSATNDSALLATRKYSGGKAPATRRTRTARKARSAAPLLSVGMKSLVRTVDAADGLVLLSASGSSGPFKRTKIFSYLKNRCNPIHREQLINTFQTKRRLAAFDEDYIVNGTSPATRAGRAKKARGLIADEMTRMIELELNPFIGPFTPTKAVCVPCHGWHLLDHREMCYSGNLVHRHMYGKHGSGSGVNHTHPPELVDQMIRTIEDVEQNVAHMVSHLEPFLERKPPMLENPATASPAAVMEYYDACCDYWAQQWQDVQRHVVEVEGCHRCTNTLETAKARVWQWAGL